MNKLYELIKSGIRWLYKTIVWSNKHLRIGSSVHFNKDTKFEGFNRICEGANVSGSSIGKYTFIGSNSNLSNCKIGKFCSIASNVTVVSATHPSHKFVSTSPIFYSTLGQCCDTFVMNNCFNEHITIDGRSAIIGNDVWVGQNVLIKGGIRINDGAIIAMGAVVTKDVPPFAIVGGVPAKVIGYRFSDSEIEFIRKTNWWEKDRDWLIDHISQFHNIEEFINIKDI